MRKGSFFCTTNKNDFGFDMLNGTLRTFSFVFPNILAPGYNQNDHFEYSGISHVLCSFSAKAKNAYSCYSWIEQCTLPLENAEGTSR
jgi:hypothetical protein